LIEEMGGGVGELNSFLVGEPVQRATDTAHLAVTLEGQGLVMLRLPQFGKSELQHRQ